MLKSFKHTISRPLRCTIATVLTIVYLMITLSPLASLAMHSKTVAHAVTGECSGDCSICGCSLESMAARTCCCSKKKQQALEQENGQKDTPGCCKTAPSKKKTEIARCGCPCGNGKTIAFPGAASFEILPFHFTQLFTQPPADSHYSNQSRLLTTRHVEPPDPPPRQA